MSNEEAGSPDPRAIAQAAAAVAAAEQEVRDAESTLATAVDALADAADDVSVLETKVSDFEADEKKLPWQIAAAQRDLAKRQRAHARAEKHHKHAIAVAEQARVELRIAVKDLAAARATPAPPAPDEAGMPPGPAPEVVAWVDKLTSFLEGPGRSESMWCPSWQEHPEAVWRFTALHREFEIAFADDTVSSWWVNHFDRHAPILFGTNGIFEACASGHADDRPFRFARRTSL